jgi:hypothetical protein
LEGLWTIPWLVYREMLGGTKESEVKNPLWVSRRGKGGMWSRRQEGEERRE